MRNINHFIVSLAASSLCHAHIQAQYPIISEGISAAKEKHKFSLHEPASAFRYNAPANGLQCMAQGLNYQWTHEDLTDALMIADECWDYVKNKGPVPACCKIPGPVPGIAEDCCLYVREHPPPKLYPSDFDNSKYKFPKPVPGQPPRKPWPEHPWEFPLFHKPGWCGGHPKTVRIIMTDAYNYLGVVVHDRFPPHPDYRGFVQCI